jgi:CheY-like chemotaxis protein
MGKTVLVVEDQPDVRDVIEMSLGEAGYRVLLAPDGAVARRILNSTATIDLLLTDVLMPGGVSGLDLARDARRLRQDLKIVVVSGYLRGDSGQSELSGLIFLEKPFLPEELTNTVAAVLAGGTRVDAR